MKSFLLAGAALCCAVPSFAAVPSCSDTIDLSDVGGVVDGTTLLTPGVCVHVGDKTFGDFTSTGPGTAAGTFTAASHFGNVTLGLGGIITSTATVTYDVAVDTAAVALGWRIDDLTKDFTLNQAAADGVTGAGTLTGHSPDNLFPDFTCARTDPPSVIDSCPVHIVFTAQSDITLEQTVAAGPNTVITGLTDTISQTNVPEPMPLAMLGVGLLGLTLVRWRRN